MNSFNTFVDKITKNQKLSIDSDATYLELIKPSSRSIRRKRNSFKKSYDYLLEDGDFFYFQFASLTLDWEYTAAPYKFVTGGFTFNGMIDALTFYSDFWKGAFSLAPDAVVPDHLKKFEQLGWFERQYRDDKRIGCFVKQPGVFPPQIAFYNRGWFQITDWTFEEYLEKMLRMYAVKGWQFFFIDFDKAMPYWQEALDDMKNAAELMPEIFEDEDWAWHQLHYEEVCKKLG